MRLVRVGFFLVVSLVIVGCGVDDSTRADEVSAQRDAVFPERSLFLQMILADITRFDYDFSKEEESCAVDKLAGTRVDDFEQNLVDLCLGASGSRFLTSSNLGSTLRRLIETCGSAADVDEFETSSRVGLYWSEPVMTQTELDNFEETVGLNIAGRPSSSPMTAEAIDFQLGWMDRTGSTLDESEIECARGELLDVPEDTFFEAIADRCLGEPRTFSVLFGSAIEHFSESPLDDAGWTCIDERLRELGPIAEFVAEPVYPLYALWGLVLGCGLRQASEEAWGVPLPASTNECLNTEGLKLTSILDEAELEKVWAFCVPPAEQEVLDEAQRMVTEEAGR